MDIYRCLIVDDEDLILQRLEKIVAAFGNRYPIIGKAYSGQEAIDIALQTKPDIILTDVVMPGMDGIEMIEQLKNKLPKTAFIILSAYTDFDYAKRAIKQNVLDYVMKVPLDPFNIRKVLDKAANKVAIMKQKEAQLTKYKRSVMENRYRMRKQVMNEIIRGETPASQIATLWEVLRIDSHLKAYNCFVLELCDDPNRQENLTTKEQSMLKYAALNIVEETIGIDAKGFACEINEHFMMGIVAWPCMSSQTLNEKRSMDLGLAIAFNIRSFLDRKCNIAFSDSAFGWHTVADSYNVACKKLEDTYHMEDGALFGPAYRSTYNKGQPYSDIQDQFRHILNQLQPASVPEWLEDDFAAIAKLANERKVGRERMEPWIQCFLYDAKRKITSWKKELPPIPLKQLSGQKCNDQLTVCSAYVRNCILIDLVSVRPEIVKAKYYIEHHISQRLILDEVAEYTNLAPSYFSYLFKRETGESLIDYINRRKMEVAMDMLKAQDYSNEAICESVGIANTKYFCTLFKQQYGQTPQKFRKQVTGK